MKTSRKRISEDYLRRSKIAADDVYYRDFILGESEVNLLGKVKGKKVLEMRGHRYLEPGRTPKRADSKKLEMEKLRVSYKA